MNAITQAYLDGLYAAALIVMDRAKDKNSPYAADIMKFRTTQSLKMEAQTK